jgi:hypothetical protein
MSALYPQELLTDSPISVDHMVFGYGSHEPQPGLVRPHRESMTPSREADRGFDGFRQPLVFYMDFAKVHETKHMMKDWANLSKRATIIDNLINLVFCKARNQVFSEQGSLRLLFNFLGIDGATLIAGFLSEVNDADEAIKSKPMKAAFTELSDIKALATDTMRKFYWFGYLIMVATDEIRRTVNNVWNPYWTKSQGQAMKSGVQHETASFNAIRKLLGLT